MAIRLRLPSTVPGDQVPGIVYWYGKIVRSNFYNFIISEIDKLWQQDSKKSCAQDSKKSKKFKKKRKERYKINSQKEQRSC